MSQEDDDRACITRAIPGVPQLAIPFPLTEREAISVIGTADAFGVEPWEMAIHVLQLRASIRALKNRQTRGEKVGGGS